MKTLFLNHKEFHNFKKLVKNLMIFDIGITNAEGVEVLYTDNPKTLKILEELGY